MAATPPLLSGSDIFWRIVAVLLLIAINGFFVTAEFSIVSVRRSRINQLASAGDIQAKTVQDLQRGLDRLLSTTQLGITLSSLALGWIGESTMAVLMAAFLWRLPLPSPLQATLAHSIAVPAAFLLIAYLQIVLGELCPKSVALLYSEEIARFLGRPSMAIARIFTPLIWVLNQSTRLLLRLVGIRYTGQGWHNRVTPEELQLIISTSTESPGLEAEERELLTNVFEFGDVSAREVMIPRTSVVALPREASFRELLEEVAASGHSRYPITGESLDDILGTLHFKELAEPWVCGELTLERSIAPWIRPAQFVPETMPVNDLLQLMQQLGQAMVIIVDEFGGTAGLVTLRDLAAEIIGDSNEPEDPGEPEVLMVDEQTFLVQAQLSVEEVNEFLQIGLPLSEEYQTLGGFLIYELQKIPAEGELLYFENLEMMVDTADGPRLDRIQIRRLDPAELAAIQRGDLTIDPFVEQAHDTAIDRSSASTHELTAERLTERSIAATNGSEWTDDRSEAALLRDDFRDIDLWAEPDSPAAIEVETTEVETTEVKSTEVKSTEVKPTADDEPGNVTRNEAGRSNSSAVDSTYRLHHSKTPPRQKL